MKKTGSYNYYNGQILSYQNKEIFMPRSLRKLKIALVHVIIKSNQRLNNFKLNCKNSKINLEMRNSKI